MREHDVADPERQQQIAVHLNAFFGDEPLSSIDIPRSRAYARARREGLIGGGKQRRDKRGADSTIGRELTMLIAAANHERKWKRLTVMPSIERPHVDPRGDVVMPYFSKEVMAQLFEAAQGDLRHWLRLSYYTGARRRSIEDLTAEQVSLLRRQITLATPGKLRTKKRQPIVPIFDEIMPDCATLVGAHPQGRLFVYNTAGFYPPFMALCRSLDLPEPHHPHMIRHSRATHLLQDGKNIWDVAGLLGDTVATVQKTYGHHSPNDLRGKLQ